MGLHEWGRDATGGAAVLSPFAAKLLLAICEAHKGYCVMIQGLMRGAQVCAVLCGLRCV